MTTATNCPACGRLMCDVLAAHKPGCLYLQAASAVGIECDHGYDICPACDPCTCTPQDGPPWTFRGLVKALASLVLTAVCVAAAIAFAFGVVHFLATWVVTHSLSTAAVRGGTTVLVFMLLALRFIVFGGLLFALPSLVLLAAFPARRRDGTL